MKWRARRQIVKNGNSLSVALPRLVLYELRLLQGDLVELIFDNDEHTVTMRPIDRRSVAAQEPAGRIGMVEVRE